MIQLDNIKKVFQTEEVETWALRNISLQVKEGEFVAIMGPSGCGKSTLLNIIGLLNNPTSGSYLLDGKDVSMLKESERTLIRRGMIGFVFQSFNLIDELNVVENIELPLLYMGVSGKERRKRTPGKEGKLGVEGMRPAVLLEALRRAGATFADEGATECPGDPITKADLFALGLTGGTDSAAKRRALLKQLALPEHLTPNGMLEALNLLYSREEFLSRMVKTQ